MTRLEEIVFLCRDSRHTLQRTLAAGNKLPLEISESLLRGAQDRVVARNNFIVFLSRYRGRDRVVPDGPEGNGSAERRRRIRVRRRYKLMSKRTYGRKAVLIRSLRSRPMTRARENKRKIAEKSRRAE